MKLFKFTILIVFLFTIGIIFPIKDSYSLSSGEVTLKKNDGIYPSWKDFWNDLEDLNDDVTLLIDPAEFSEDTAPDPVTVNLNGHTLHIKPSNDKYFPTSSDCNTGPRFLLNYSSTDYEFLDLNMSGTGHVIIEGICVEVKSGSTTPTQVIYSHPQNACNVTIRRCVFKGQQDGDGIRTSDADPIQRIYNNFFYDFDDAVYIDENLSMGSFLLANTIYGCDNHGIDVNSKSGTFENNIVYNCGTDLGFNSIGSAYGYNNLTGPYDNSCADGNWVDGFGNLTDKTLTFTDAANDEFFLQSSGCDDAINKGLGNFSSYDTNLQAQYKFEPSHLTDDATDNNTLINYGTPDEIIDCMVGDGALHFANNEGYYTLNSNLSDDFPGKSGGGNADLTLAVWYKPGIGANNQWAGIAGIWNGGTEDGRVWLVFKDNLNRINFYKGYNDGVDTEGITHDSALICDGAHWYYIGVSYNDSTKAVRIRIWDHTAGDVLGVDKTDTHAEDMDDTTTVTADFRVNYYYHDGAPYIRPSDMDDLRIYNAAFTASQIDDIRHIRYETDSFGRNRIENFDIGAFEYIAPCNFGNGYYIDSVSGSNGNDGTSDEQAWADFTNLDDKILNPGDKIKLKRGCTFDDTLWLRAVGSTSNHVTVTAYDNGNDPIINGEINEGGITILSSYHVDFSNIVIQDCDGIFSFGSRGLSFSNVESNDNGYSGFYISYSSNFDLDSCTANWNATHGIYLRGITGDCNINNSTFNYNGQISTTKYGCGIKTSSYNYGELSDSEHDDPINVNNCEIKHNGYIGIAVGKGSLIENCDVAYNGDGWGTQGVIVFGGSLTGALNNGDSLTQDNTGATGTVHHCQSPYHMTGADHDNDAWLSIYWISGTFSNEDDIKKDANNYWSPNSKASYRPCGNWSGGGIDLRYADDAIVRYNIVSYTKKIPSKSDGYGIDIDDNTDNSLVYYNICHHNDGGGIEFHNSGKITANKAYHNLCYANSIKATYSGGIFLNLPSSGQAIIKNNVSALDEHVALKAGNNVNNENIVLDNNCYWMGADDNKIINWRGYEYVAADDLLDDFDDFQIDTGQGSNGIVEDPQITGFESGFYQIRSTSPCKDHGSNDVIDDIKTVTGLSPIYDYFGTEVPILGTCDIGIHEYVECYDNDDCGTCKKCEDNSCVFQTNSEDLKGECPDEECMTGFCNGAGACGFEPSTTECRASAGVCDVAESCTGSSAQCPNDIKSTDICRSSEGGCDVSEYCDGVNNDCPADNFKPTGTPCTDDVNVCTYDECDEAGLCTHPNNNDPCVDGIACTDNDVCSGGVCIGTPKNSFCDDGNVCTDDNCIVGVGCNNPPNKNPCNDGIYCNGTDTCSGGSCSVHSGNTCNPGTECNEETDSCNLITTTTTAGPSTTTTQSETTTSILPPAVCDSIITPSSAEVVSGGTLSFTVTLVDEGNMANCLDPDYKWSVKSDIGSVIDEDGGTYTPGINLDLFNKETDVVRVDDNANGVSAEANVLVSMCALVQIYGDNTEQVELLRNFRDNVLRKTPEGQEIIRLYYQWSPVIVKMMEEDEEFKEEVKGMIDGVLELITETE